MFRCEKDGGGRNFFRVNGALHGDHGHEEVANRGIVQLGPRQRCFHQAWRDPDDADAAGAQLQRTAPCSKRYLQRS